MKKNWDFWGWFAFPASGGGLPEPIPVINLDMIAWDGNNDSLAMFHTTPSLPISLEFADRMYYLIGKYKLPLNVIVKNPGEPNLFTSKIHC